MPAYLVNLDWSDDVVVAIKKALSLFLPHPICNIFLAFVCYYIMLLTFRVRPYLAIAGALAFGLSSYMIIGLAAGHNARIGAIAFMPLVMAGIHLSFSQKRVLGFGMTAAGLALHLRENHVQITYYLVMIVMVYGLVQFIYAMREKQIREFGKTLGVLVIAVVVAAGTFFGPLWALTEFSRYSTRGNSELRTISANTAGSGLPKSYAFEYSNGMLEPITAFIPSFFGGASSNSFVSDQTSKTYQALASSRDQKLVNQLVQYSSSYWGDQPLSAPYYSGAIIVFLFVLGCTMADKKYVLWLVPVSGLAIMLSWGSNFESFNYFLFDHLPGYNKFRSVTFVMVVVFFSMPLLGMLGLERLLEMGLSKEQKRKLLIAFGITGGVSLLLFLFGGMLSYSKASESELPVWFLQALREDRRAMLAGDALRTFGFVFAIFILLFLDVPRRISLPGFLAFLIVMVLIDTIVVDNRYFTKDNYQRKHNTSILDPLPVNKAILRDKGYYRVFNFNFYEAGTSSFHHSLGGYNGVRMKRYQELFDSCIINESDQVIAEVQQGKLDFRKFGVLNMLNAKYLVYGGEANNFIPNNEANGYAWFVKEATFVNSPTEELEKLKTINTKEMAVVDASKFKLERQQWPEDSLASIKLADQKPYWMKYETQSANDGLAVFSEIFYPEGWSAKVDGKEVPILRVNYVLRALQISSGKHVVEFLFQPKPYLIGNKVTMASSWLLLVLVAGSLGWSWGRNGS